MSTPKGKIRVYAAGGAGVNVGSLLEKHREQDEQGFGLLDIVYIDTSRSNISNKVDDKHCYLFNGIDGSGKLRRENHVEIGERVRAILHQFKPADLNIIISSAGGGSGSVIGPLLAKELLTNDAPVIVLTIGSADTRLDAENSLKTIMSYESISKSTGKPLVMSYLQNNPSRGRNEVDGLMFNTIIALTVLFSRQNQELDSKDLFNWLRFDRVTTFHTQLAALTISDNSCDLSNADIGNIISIATLAKQGESTSFEQIPEYQTVGFLPDMDGPVLEKAPIHYIVSDGVIHPAAMALREVLDDLERQKAAREPRKSLANDGNKPSDNGLVL